MVRLRRVDCAQPGITRRGRGRGWQFLDRHGETITDPEVIARCKALAIPPAWRDVWICEVANGHLQAVGTDAAGRRQYRYHDEWRRRRDTAKFDDMLDFARALPDLRAHCTEVLAAGDEPSRDRVLACAVRLLDLGFFRVGGDQGPVEAESFGLTTIRKDHVRISADALHFTYPAKGGIDRQVTTTDPSIRELVATMRRRRSGGDELLAYKVGRAWVDVTARDVNELIKAHCGEAASAKTFRTWSGTVLAAVALAVAGWASSATQRRRAEARAAAEVAEYLGNTPTVARSSYIDPRVFDHYRADVTIAGAIDELAATIEPGQPAIHGHIEEAVIGLLTDPDAAEAVLVGPLGDSAIGHDARSGR